MRVLISGLALITMLGQSTFAQEGHRIRLGAENSTVTSGLMDYLIPKFTQETGIEVQVDSVGTTEALYRAHDGLYDVILTANPFFESVFMREGYGEQRYSVMSTNLVLIGPNSDPAGILEEPGDLNAVMTRIFRGGTRNTFVSLGDNSAVDIKEKEIWRTAGYKPTNNSWYKESASDSTGALTMANELNGYAFIDRPTLLNQQDKYQLKPVYSRPPLVELDYSVITVSVHKIPDVNRVDATKFAYWITSPEGQEYIRGYTPANTIAYQPRAAVIAQ